MILIIFIKGQWTRILNKIDRSQAFNKTLLDFEKGFGSQSGNYWVGFQTIFEFLGKQKLNIKFEFFNDGKDTHINTNDETLWYSEHDEFDIKNK